jgi:hypothetical protein
MMSISKIVNETALSQVAKQSSAANQAQQDFNTLFQAMANNDISGAQEAYASIQQSQSPQANPHSGTAADPLTAVKSDWASLGQALQSGSLTSAQQAFSQLGQDALAVQQARLQHVIASTSALKNDVQSIDQALKSGDTSSAQKLLAQLEQNLQSSRMAFGYAPAQDQSTAAAGTTATSSTAAPSAS